MEIGRFSIVALLPLFVGRPLALGCGGASAESPGSIQETAGLVGRKAPNFSVDTVAGSKGQVSIANLRGKVVLIDFWATFCEPCKKSFPKLQALQSKYDANGLKIVGISEDEAEDKDKIADFARAYGAKFTLAWDGDKAIAQSYKPETMPSSFLIDKMGVVRFAHVGYHDGDAALLDKEIQGLLQR